MEQKLRPPRVKAGPAISALSFLEASNGQTVSLLGEREHGLLAEIASTIQFKRGATIFREGDPALFIYNIAHGVVRVGQTSFEGRRHIAAFMFDDDLFGLAEEGVYVNEAQAVTVTTAYRMPIEAFVELTRHEPVLDHSLLLKLTHELREGERHGMILTRHDAVGRIVLFIEMLERLGNQRGRNTKKVYLPMLRSDIADYVGLSLPAVSRAFHMLASHNIIQFSDRRHLQIIDRTRFEELISHETRGAGPVSR
jgi:CRP-like cAMP-binding protein